jgi:hypothetical protein
MNYFSRNSEIRQSVLRLLGGGFTSATQVSIAVSYAQSRRWSMIEVELSPSSVVHSLIFIYNWNLALHDVLIYRNKRYVRAVQSGAAFKLIEGINQFLWSRIPRYNPVGGARYEIEDERRPDTALKR